MKRLLLALLVLAGCAGQLAADEAPMNMPVPAQAVTVPGAEGTPLRALLFVPASPTRPPVVALHSCSGIGSAQQPITLAPHQRDWAARLVAAGHPVVFPDSFGSRGLGPACGVPNFPAGPVGVRRFDALEAARWARAQPWARGEGVVLIGWSHGGTTTLAAWNSAPPGLVRAAVALYPGCGRGSGPPVPAVQGTAPLLMLLGQLDDWTPAAPCEQVATLAPRLITRVTFPGAHHSFDGLSGGIRQRHLPNGNTVSLGPDPAARTESRRLVAEFLQEHAGPP
ncbi:dienelactone hydrolase family protein [Roseococcus sp. YIM B11640]|uniref:dienelactone hydrolase family protein n=1 Tax=Roseococcus sp. YIM B11640 TaxID=3133973 RepID=UPI003C7D9FA3